MIFNYELLGVVTVASVNCLVVYSLLLYVLCKQKCVFRHVVFCMVMCGELLLLFYVMFLPVQSLVLQQMLLESVDIVVVFVGNYLWINLHFPRT